MNYKTFELVSAGCLNLEGLLGAWIQIYRLFVSVDLEVFASVFFFSTSQSSLQGWPTNIGTMFRLVGGLQFTSLPIIRSAR